MGLMHLRRMEGDAQRPDYGVDAPGVVRVFAIAGPILFIWGWFKPALHIGDFTWHFRGMFISTGFVFMMQALLMYVYAKRWKFKHRDRMLALHAWRGDERVLDVGCGLGLLMVGAAKRLTTGRSIGVDIWSGKDLSNNTPQHALRNATLEGMADRVEVRTESIVETSFADASFDVVLSNLCIHNIPKRTDRDRACREIARILKPGGEAIISDFQKTADYSRVLREAGLNVERVCKRWTDTFPPLTVIRARRRS
jgi:arsenite methyltransferase